MKFDLKSLGEKAAEFIPVAIAGLEVIAHVVGGEAGHDLVRVAENLDIVKAVIKELEGAYGGTVSAKDAGSAIVKLRTQIADNDAKADEALKKKFPT